MTMITLVFTYYENPEMLRQQVIYWRGYLKKIADRVKIIIVDDGSTNYLAENEFNKFNKYTTLSGLDVSLYRIKEDIYQNTVGARNLGFTQAPEGWVFNLDMDHIVPSESMENLLQQLDGLCPSCYYLPDRRAMVNLDEYKNIWRHSDTFIMQRKTFWKIGGYNERYVGYYYNGPCLMFRRAAQRISKQKELENVWTLLFGPDVIGDASPLFNTEKKKLGEHINYNQYNPIEPLQFNWEQII